MDKTEFIAQIAKSAQLETEQVQKAVDALLASISDELKQGQVVKLPGLGTFSVQHRAERTVKDPESGKEITTAALNAVRFRPAQKLKQAVE